MCNCGGGFKKSIRTNKPNNNTNTTPVVNDKTRILSLWKGVLNNETYAKAEFVRTYLRRFPQNKLLTDNLTNENLHKMYVDLTH
jgi:hypothetical protein